MKGLLFYSALIAVIEKIYLKIAVTILHKRMHAHHQISQQEARSYTQDIKSPMLECIDEIISDSMDTTSTVYSMHYVIPTSARTNLHEPGAIYTEVQHVIDKKNVGELSRYFKERRNGAEIHPDIAEKLERSIWEHTFSSVRYAREGDNHNASMHADIADYGCKELAHYLSEEDYRHFTKTVEEHINSLKLDSRDT